MILSFVLAILASAVAIGLFYFAMKNSESAYGFDEDMPYIAAWIVTAGAAGLWLWWSSNFAPALEVVRWASISLLAPMLMTLYLVLREVPYWAPEWVHRVDDDWWGIIFGSSLFLSYAGLLAFAALS